MKMIAAFIAVLLIWSEAFAGDKAMQLYKSGDKAAARRVFEQELKAARGGKRPDALWTALMRAAWFADETGEPKRSIEFSNEALEVASKINNNFMIGRSLCWLGWAYSSMGRYTTAITFYEEAVKLGAPDGKIEIIPVWGLASQELGAIYFKMGETKKAKEILLETTKVAREHKVLAGVAEGGAHLAEIALVEGDIEEAWRWAKEGVKAADECACSPFNLARAKVVKAKVGVERAKRKSMDAEDAEKLIDEALDYSKKVGVVTLKAQAMILKSKAGYGLKSEKRLELLEDAIKTLEKSEHETRGAAQGALGGLWLDEKAVDLAEGYLKQGLKVNQEMLRQVDSAYMMTSIAELSGLKGDKKKELEELKAAADFALSTGDLTVAYKSSRKIGEMLLEDGYDSMARGWFESSAKALKELIDREEVPEVRSTLEREYIEIRTVYSELSAELTNEGSAEIPLS
ncbi:MAG: tetratricopeptide repeat protein [Deltaproteobacteria bacterium]|nr:tetratricopeptide repeat protein [Deltaproteobacteria bacterium]